MLGTGEAVIVAAKEKRSARIGGPPWVPLGRNKDHISFQLLRR
jgi:hypothetical protein